MAATSGVGPSMSYGYFPPNTTSIPAAHAFFLSTRRPTRMLSRSMIGPPTAQSEEGAYLTHVQQAPGYPQGLSHTWQRSPTSWKRCPAAIATAASRSAPDSEIVLCFIASPTCSYEDAQGHWLRLCGQRPTLRSKLPRTRTAERCSACRTRSEEHTSELQS